MNVPSLTAVVLTKNEELHLVRCIESLKGCASRLIVVDSFSSDSTVDLARKSGAEVYERVFVNHADQFNWALDNCSITSDWTMRIDADEYIDMELSREILHRLSTLPDSTTGVSVARHIKFAGRIIRHGGVSPQRSLKIWRTGLGRLENRWMDEHVAISHGNITAFKGALVDENLNGMTSWIEKHNRYATREMIDFLNKEYELYQQDAAVNTSQEAASKRRKKTQLYNRSPLLYRAIALFIYRYILRLGFLDGKAGLSFCLMQTLWYRYLVDLKIIEARTIIKSSGMQEFKLALKSDHGIVI